MAKIYGSITEVTSLQFREDTYLITFQANQSTTYTAARALQLPPGDASMIIVGDTATQTLTNKTLTAPDINAGTADSLTSLSIRDTSAAYDVTLTATSSSALTAGRTLTLDMVNAARSIKLQGNLDIGGNLTTGGAVTTTSTVSITGAFSTAAAFSTSGANSLVLTTTGSTNVTLPTSGTLAITGNPLSQFAATTSAQLAGVISDETGSGALVFADTPTLVTPVLGVATATSVNKVVITAPATSATLTIAEGKTLTASNTLTFTGTDSTSFAFPSGSSTVMTLASTDTITGVKTFGDGSVKLSGSSSGASTLKAPAAASTYVHTLPALTSTLMGSATGFTTTGQLPYYNSSSAGFEATANGVKGTVLISQGATSAPQSRWSKTYEYNIGDADYTITDSDGYTLIRSSTTLTAARTITLPTVADNTGREITFIKAESGAYSLIIDGEGAETLSGLLAIHLFAEFDTVTLVSDGTRWVVMSLKQSIKVSAHTTTTAASSTTPFVYSTEVLDTARAYASGVFTVPTSGAGFYQIHGQAYSGGAFTVYVYKNGSQIAQGTVVASASQASSVSAGLLLADGDTIDIRPDASVTGTGGALINRFSIVRIW